MATLQEKKDQAVELIKKDYDVKDVVKIVGLSSSVVYRIKRSLNAESNDAAQSTVETKESKKASQVNAAQLTLKAPHDDDHKETTEITPITQDVAQEIIHKIQQEQAKEIIEDTEEIIETIEETIEEITEVIPEEVVEEITPEEIIEESVEVTPEEVEETEVPEKIDQIKAYHEQYEQKYSESADKFLEMCNVFNYVNEQINQNEILNKKVEEMNREQQELMHEFERVKSEEELIELAYKFYHFRKKRRQVKNELKFTINLRALFKANKLHTDTLVRMSASISNLINSTTNFRKEFFDHTEDSADLHKEISSLDEDKPTRENTFTNTNTNANTNEEELPAWQRAIREICR